MSERKMKVEEFIGYLETMMKDEFIAKVAREENRLHVKFLNTVDYFSRLINYKKELGVQDKVVNYVNDILNTTTDSSIREKYNYFINTFRLKVNE